MKHSVLAITILFAATMLGQALTPNIDLYLPGHNSQQWDNPLNANFGLLDLFLSGNRVLPALALSGFVAPGVVTVATLPSTAPINAHVAVSDGTTPYDCVTGGGSAAVHECYCAAVTSGSCSAWLPVVPAPSASIGGVVKQTNCGGSAIQAINADTSTTCAASPSGGNGVIYQVASQAPVAGDGTYKTLYTYTLPGNTLSSSGGIKVTCILRSVTGRSEE